MIEVKGGTVTCPNAGTAGPNKAYVEKIVFENGVRINGIAHANGGDIILTIVNVPDYRNFEKGDELQYEDGNRNNDRTFRVVSVMGPCKYKLAEQ